MPAGVLPDGWSTWQDHEAGGSSPLTGITVLCFTWPRCSRKEYHGVAGRGRS